MKTITLPKNRIHTGNLILVNARYPYQGNNAGQDLESIHPHSPVLLERNARESLAGIMEEIGGWRKITAVSGWRPLTEQQEIYGKSLKENGIAYTTQFVALPGHSEHQTGLAIDLALSKEEIDFICPDFPESGICRTFRERAAAYGFVERYPQDKESVTGIAHEPWHFRYVGTPHAGIMEKQQMVLEEYIAFLKGYRYGERGYDWQEGKQSGKVSYLEASEGEAVGFERDSRVPLLVSGNNVDGYIITEWNG